MINKVLAFTKQLSLFLMLNTKLPKSDFTVINVADSEGLFSSLRQHDIDVVIFDDDISTNLNDILIDTRSNFTGPLIVITKRFNQNKMLKYFTLKIDDYLVFPIEEKELILRIKQRLWSYRSEISTNNHLKNTQINNNLSKKRIINLNHHGLAIDLPHYRVLRGKEDLGLTPKEFKLFIYLIKHSGQVLTREQILDRIWGYDDISSFTRIVDIHISHLRDKIEKNPQDPQLIKTVRGFGYICEIEDNIKYTH